MGRYCGMVPMIAEEGFAPQEEGTNLGGNVTLRATGMSRDGTQIITVQRDPEGSTYCSIIGARATVNITPVPIGLLGNKKAIHMLIRAEQLRHSVSD